MIASGLSAATGSMTLKIRWLHEGERWHGDAKSKANRVRQWLGLHPNRDYACVVELCVTPDDLARPCPDNEVVDRICRLGNPEGDTNGYATWFAERMSRSYVESDGSPWTRLGYTYDWAPKWDTANAKRPIGASEFILRPHAPYRIAGRYRLAEYCEAPPNATPVSAATPTEP